MIHGHLKQYSNIVMIKENIFNTFPVNMILQYKKVGKWQNYLYGERAYMILSLVAKTLLAWLVLFGAMQP